MKDDFRKPLYKDYKRQFTPLRSGDKQYEIADGFFVTVGAILCVLVPLAMAVYSPFRLAATPAMCLGALLLYPYLTKFVYRFGRFHIKWEDWTQHPGEEQASENCDRWGDFLDTEENRKAAKRTRRAFLIFYAAMIAAFFLFCFLGYGLSYARVYGWHKGEIDEAAQIAQKYESLFITADDFNINVQGEAADGSGISEQDAERLKQIAGSLQWEYVSTMGLRDTYKGPSSFYIGLRGGFSYSYLVRYEDILNISQAEKEHPDRQVTQLDEHWWYVR